MKHIALFCLLAGLCYTADEARAQQSPISFGLKGGVNMTTVAGDDANLSASKFLPIDMFSQFGSFDVTAEPQSKTLFSGGVYVAYMFNSLLSAQAEAMYTSKGVSYDKDFSYSLSIFGSLSGNMKADAELTYIDIPLLLKITAPVEGSIKPYVVVGPSFGILVDKTTSVEGSAKVVVSGQSNEVLNGPIPAVFTFNNLDIGATFGGGISFRTIATAIGVEARYTMGFQSAVKSVSVDGSALGVGDTSSELDMKNRAFGITAFMEFYF